jgi:dienelactone hydrolase
MRYVAGLLIFSFVVSPTFAEAPLAVGEGTRPQDRRNDDLQNLNGYFPFKPVDNVQQWKRRQSEIRRRILVSQGLWPLPTKSPLNAVIHGRVEREDYVVDRVFFESAPGHFVTGSLYRPQQESGSKSMPAILSPHGHWANGRFYDAGEALVKSQVEAGAETSLINGRYPIQARAVQLARMGCLVFVYDMTGNADAIQIEHRPAKWSHLDTRQDWGFMSVQADLRLQNMMGLQTWNSIRAIDFLLELDETDPNRIGVTGASGGGTQSMIIAAIDDRITAAMPCVMVSTAMQGGCTCENAPLMRIDQGNIDIAAAIAPRPLGLTAADDWTIELETKGYPDLVHLYEMLGHPDRLTAVFHTQFKHNYNQVNRGAMYSFFNRHFQLGLQEPIIERDYVPLSREEATVWTDDYPPPSGNQVGDAHEIRLLKMATKDSDRQLQKLIPSSSTDLPDFQDVVGGAWETILGRRLDEVGKVTFAESNRSDRDRYTERVGLVEHADQGEQIPTLILESKAKSNGTVIWITDSGTAAVYENDIPTKSVRELIAAGFNVIAADLYGQGESGSDDRPVDAQRMWYQRDGKQGWERFSGYTHGYNHCLFAQRVHDILSLVKYAKSRDEGDVHLVGLGKVAGPLVAAARSQSGSAIADTVVDMQGFRFENLDRHDDPMFVPGAVKYLDVDGILSLCAPAKLHLLGKEPSAIATRVYLAIGSASSLTFVKHADSKVARPIVDMIRR